MGGCPSWWATLSQNATRATELAMRLGSCSNTCEPTLVTHSQGPFQPLFDASNDDEFLQRLDEFSAREVQSQCGVARTRPNVRATDLGSARAGTAGATNESWTATEICCPNNVADGCGAKDIEARPRCRGSMAAAASFPPKCHRNIPFAPLAIESLGAESFSASMLSTSAHRASAGGAPARSSRIRMGGRR